MTVLALGRVLGLLLDRHASTEPGQARVIHRSFGEGVEESRIFWHSASVWRVERGPRGVVCDGKQVQEWAGRKRQPPHAARAGHPDWHLQLVFPLRAAVFGRSGDDYFPAGVQEHEAGVLIRLEGTEDDRAGHLVVDTGSGFIREAMYLDGRRSLHLEDLKRGPLADPDSLFAVK